METAQGAVQDQRKISSKLLSRNCPQLLAHEQQSEDLQRATSGKRYKDKKQLHETRMGHTAGKGYLSEFHDGLVHKPISIKKVMKISEAEAAADKEWDQLANL